MKGREIVMMTLNVLDLWSVEVIIVISGETVTVITVADNLRGMRARAAQQIVSALGLLFVATMTADAG